jgi:hypothetical protein
MLDKQTARKNIRLALGLAAFAAFMFAAAFVVALLVIHAF